MKVSPLPLKVSIIADEPKIASGGQSDVLPCTRCISGTRPVDMQQAVPID